MVLFSRKWMELEIIILSKTNRIQKGKQQFFSHEESRVKTKKDMKVEREPFGKGRDQWEGDGDKTE
jgi:hypothetical protein